MVGPRATPLPSFILTDPIVWLQYTNVTDRQTDRTDRQPSDSKTTRVRYHLNTNVMQIQVMRFSTIRTSLFIKLKFLTSLSPVPDFSRFSRLAASLFPAVPLFSHYSSSNTPHAIGLRVPGSDGKVGISGL